MTSCSIHDEVVTIHYANGYARDVDVTADSYIPGEAVPETVTVSFWWLASAACGLTVSIGNNESETQYNHDSTDLDEDGNALDLTDAWLFFRALIPIAQTADDYVVKPFSVRELVLRIRAILRRGNRPGMGTALCRGALLLDVEAHRVTLDGQEVALTATEFRLLEDLMRHAGAVRTREQLLNAVWGYSFEGYARTVDTHVRRLRAKLGEEAAALETVRGVGYRLRG